MIAPNVGRMDRTMRAVLAAALVGVGMVLLDGMHGSLLGIAVALTALMPLYMTATGRCFVFHALRVHTLSAAEKERYGDPYPDTRSKDAP